MALEEGLIFLFIFRELFFCNLCHQFFVHRHIGVEDREHRVAVKRAENCLHVDVLDFVVVLDSIRDVDQLLQVDLSVSLEDLLADVSALSLLQVDTFAVYLALLCNQVEVPSPVLLDFHENEVIFGFSLFYGDALSHPDTRIHIPFWSDELTRRIHEENLLRLILRNVKDNDPVLNGDLKQIFF